MKVLLRRLMLVAVLMATSFVAEAQPLLATRVETGKVKGVLDDGLAVYKAIPYAAPPVGDLRWRAPQPAKAWKGVRVCDTFGPMPPQPTRPGRTADRMNEDCLYLGIATPAKAVTEKLPVMVWIHGGGFQTEWYGGDLWKRLAQRGVVIVSIEYRTGALGFMAHPELTKESPDGHSGNYGLLDQIYALQWVQRNIAQFGGDPTKVTIFGESAGAISCSMLCASPLAKGLFRGCISHSGGSFAPWSDRPRSLGLDASQQGAESQGVAFQKHLKKKCLKELREMDAMALCDGNVGFNGFWPCVDGYVICDDQYRLYERGEYNDVPVIVMTNSDEGALFAPGNIKAEDYQKTVKGIFGDWADKALQVYPGRTNDEAWHGFADCFRDMGFAWPSYAWVNLQSKTGKSAAYAAYLAQPSTESFSHDTRRKGVAHADDIMYLNGHFLDNPQKYPAESAVSEMMQQYWVNFAKTGNPNGKGLPYWPTFDESKPTTMQFSDGASLIDVPNRQQIDFVDSYYRAKRAEVEAARRQANQLYVGSYNIRYQNDGDAKVGNGWQQRMPVLCSQILFEHPDIFGAQEVLESQRQDLLKQLPDYDCIGLGRDDGQHAGEHSNIFYDRNKIKLLDHGDFWLSETPEKPGLGWDAACVRICSWGYFKLKGTNLDFYYFNLHMDHVGTVARREGAKLVVQRIKDIAKGKPVVLTGDFNVDQTNEIYSIFTQSGILNDSYEKAQLRFAENGTFNSWDPELKTDSRIDHVFVSPCFAVERYGVLTNAYWSEAPQNGDVLKGANAPQEINFQKHQKRLPSDHYPVFVRLRK